MTNRENKTSDGHARQSKPIKLIGLIALCMSVVVGLQYSSKQSTLGNAVTEPKQSQSVSVPYENLVQIQQKKQRFFDALVPSVIEESQAILAQRESLHLMLSSTSFKHLLELELDSKVSDIKTILEQEISAEVGEQTNEVDSHAEVKPVEHTAALSLSNADSNNAATHSSTASLPVTKLFAEKNVDSTHSGGEHNTQVRASFDPRQHRGIVALLAHYRLSDSKLQGEALMSELLQRVDIIPPSLILAQAANESGWGTSRFARQGNNYFGQWCFEPGCGLVPAGRAEGEIYEVSRFESLEASVRSYIRNLNTHNAYQDFRQQRANLRAQQLELGGADLADGLLHYSERGEAYAAELKSIIRVNKLKRFNRQLGSVPIMPKLGAHKALKKVVIADAGGGEDTF